MPNTYFAFKTFTIHQSLAAMKVTTEACLFGAWASKSIQQQTNVLSIADIGAGTGLLSILIAQHTDAAITAIEINHQAVAQIQQNVTYNNLQHQIEICHSNIVPYAATGSKQFDCIISNPPFYQQQLLSQQQSRNIALHDAGLTFVQLFTAVHQLLQPQGIFFMLIPYYRLVETVTLAQQYQLFASNICTVQQTPKHTNFRAMLAFTHNNKKLIEENIVIKNTDGNYSLAFTHLLQPYYLHL
jgi:tRNA1Val (adenine37-N6)-methyltransferase